MANLNKPDDGTNTLVGLLRLLAGLSTLGFPDPEELARALAAWHYDLSHTEIRILEHLMRGLTDSEIAERMGIAQENTIKNHLKAIYKKMGARNRTQAATLFARYGFGEQLHRSQRPNE